MLLVGMVLNADEREPALVCDSHELAAALSESVSGMIEIPTCSGLDPSSCIRPHRNVRLTVDWRRSAASPEMLADPGSAALERISWRSRRDARRIDAERLPADARPRPRADADGERGPEVITVADDGSAGRRSRSSPTSRSAGAGSHRLGVRRATGSPRSVGTVKSTSRPTWRAVPRRGPAYGEPPAVP